MHINIKKQISPAVLMSEYGKTKADILKLIAERKDTLTEISKSLGLAPSTVSKHLTELSGSGTIQLVESGYAKKWKHYVINPEARASIPETVAVNQAYNNKSKVKYAFLTLIAVAAIAGLIIYLSNAPGANYVPISITDPPQVPVGTQAVYVNYSSLAVGYVKNGITRNITINSSGQLNLLDLINVTQVIGVAKIPDNSRITNVTFNISSGSIIIDNSTYALNIAMNKVSAAVLGNKTINSSSAVLIDFSPVIAPQVYGNSVLFTLIPKVNAEMAFGGQYKEAMKIGNGPNQASYKNRLFQINNTNGNFNYSNIQSPISINEVYFNESNTSAKFGVTVYNSANSTTEINQVIIMSCGLSAGMQYPNATNAVQNATGIYKRSKNGSIEINITKAYSEWLSDGGNNMYISLKFPANTIKIYGNKADSGPKGINGFMQAPFGNMQGGISFQAISNGTLELFNPMNGSCENSNYSAKPESNSTILYATTSKAMASLLSGILNNSYKVVVVSSSGITVYTHQNQNVSSNNPNEWGC